MVDFLIIGGGQCEGYKDIFYMIKEGKIRFGVSESLCFIHKDGVKHINSRWFTNLDPHKEVDFLDLKDYEEWKYERFDNYDAINIDRTEDIPDYSGVMGVPLSFLIRWNKRQFDVIDMATDWAGKEKAMIRGKEYFQRILIKKI